MKRFPVWVILCFFHFPVSGQEWSAGLDLISLGKFIGGEQAPVILQVKRNWNERNAVRLDMGMYHIQKDREWDYFNSGNGAKVLCDAYEEINYKYTVQLGWEFAFLERERFDLYAYPGMIFNFFSTKKKIKIPECRAIIAADPPGPAVSFYEQPQYDDHGSNYGIFLTLGAGLSLSDRISFSLESEIQASNYKESRYEETFYWVFDPNAGDPAALLPGQGHFYDEKGSQFQAWLVQHLFIRYHF